MVILLPRLPTPAAEMLLVQHMADGFAAWSGFDADALPEAVRFAATGGSQGPPKPACSVARPHSCALRDRTAWGMRVFALPTPRLMRRWLRRWPKIRYSRVAKH